MLGWSVKKGGKEWMGGKGNGDGLALGGRVETGMLCLCVCRS